MPEVKKIKAGSFKTMDLHPNLLRNIPFDNPTPIQRKTIPLILEGRNIMGIARTGSGKTLCYLLPAIIKAIKGENTLILLPTKELVFQVKGILKRLTQDVLITGKITVTTLRSLDVNETSLLVVDEIDRVLEEPSLLAFFEEITANVTCQRIFFSATLPFKPIDIQIVQIDNKIPETIQHFFFYVPSESKEGALLHILDREKKTIVFVATRYGVDFLLGLLQRFSFNARGIYSSMDDDARATSFSDFMSGRVKILVVTDVAARGLDIPQLDVSISYDLSDEKTFVHRVGRIRGMGAQFSFVTYSDVFHFFNIRETHLPSAIIGTIPQDILDRYDVSERGDLSGLKYLAMRGYQRCLDFRRKVSVPSEFKALVESFEAHPMFGTVKTLADELKKAKARPAVRAVEKPSFKDIFYIPYSKTEQKTHCSVFAVGRDDYRRPEKRENNRFNKNKKRNQ